MDICHRWRFLRDSVCSIVLPPPVTAAGLRFAQLHRVGYNCFRGMLPARTVFAGEYSLDINPVEDLTKLAPLKHANGIVLSCRHHYNESPSHSLHEMAG